MAKYNGMQITIGETAVMLLEQLQKENIQDFVDVFNRAVEYERTGECEPLQSFAGIALQEINKWTDARHNRIDKQTKGGIEGANRRYGDKTKPRQSEIGTDFETSINEF